MSKTIFKTTLFLIPLLFLLSSCSKSEDDEVGEEITISLFQDSLLLVPYDSVNNLVVFSAIHIYIDSPHLTDIETLDITSMNSSGVQIDNGFAAYPDGLINSAKFENNINYFGTYYISSSDVYRLTVTAIPFDAKDLTTPLEIVINSGYEPVIDSGNAIWATAPAYIGDSISLFTVLSEKNSGDESIRYNWYKDGLPLADTTDSLTFSSCADSNSGTYKCVVRNLWGQTLSSEFELSVAANLPPVWSYSAISNTIVEGENFTLDINSLCTDLEGKPLSFTLDESSELLVTVTDGIVNYTSTYSENGNHSFIVIASDGVNSSTKLFTLVILDDGTKSDITVVAMADTVVTVDIPLTLKASAVNAVSYHWTIEGTEYETAVGSLNHSFTTLGDKTVLVKILDGIEKFSAVDTINVLVIHPGAPTVTAMGDTTIEANETLDLTALGTDEDGVVTKYYWAVDGSNYSDTSTGLTSSLAYKFGDFGTFNVLVKSVDDDGFSSAPDTIVVTVNKAVPTVIGMSDTTISLGDSATITALGEDADGTITKYLWAVDGINFDDLTTNGSIKVAFNTTGEKKVLVKVVDNDLQSSLIDTIVVTVNNEVPTVIGMSDTTIFLNDSATITALGEDADGTITKYLWAVDGINFDTLTTGGSIKVAFNTIGEKKVLVKVADNGLLNSLVDTITISVVESYEPTAQDLSITFDATSENLLGLYQFADIDNGETEATSLYRWRRSGTTIDSGSASLDTRKVSPGETITFEVMPVSSGYPHNGQWTALTMKYLGAHRTYGGSDNDTAHSITPATGGGYIIAGTTESHGSGGVDAWVVKIDELGDTLWTQTYGGSDDDIVNSIIPAAGGGYILSGYSNSYNDYNSNRNDFWAVKISETGVEEWNEIYGGTGDDIASSITPATGGYILAGNTTPTVSYSSFLTVKISEAGDEVWSDTSGSVVSDYATSITPANGGGYIIGGYTNLTSDFLVVKISEDGVSQPANNYGGTGSDTATSITPAIGGYILAGYSTSSGSNDFCAVKFDDAGDEDWIQNYGGTGSDVANSIISATGGYILTGYTYSEGAGDADFWAVKINESGDKDWGKTYGGTGTEGAKSIIPAAGGGYLITGYTDSFGEGGNDFWVVKIDENGKMAFPPGVVIE
jgi:hypothetical protein